MVRFTAVWAWIQLKTAFRNATFYLMIALMTLGFILADSIVHKYEEDIVVPIYTSETALGEYILESLEKNTPDGYRFVRGSSESEVVDSVTKSEVPCGIIISEDADEMLPYAIGVKTIPQGKTLMGINVPVQILQSSGVPEGYIIQEILFPIVQRSISSEWIGQYASDEAMQYVQQDYSNRLDNMDLTIFKVVNINRTDVINNSKSDDSDTKNSGRHIENSGSHTKTVIRCVLIIILLMLCILDVRDGDKGFYAAFAGPHRFVLKGTKVAVNVFMVTLIATIIYLLYLNLINI